MTLLDHAFEQALGTLSRAVEANDVRRVDVALAGLLGWPVGDFASFALNLLADDLDTTAGLSIVHACESMADDEYAKTVLSVLPALRSLRWSEILVLRVLNSDSARERLLAHAEKSSLVQRRVLRSICERAIVLGAELADKAAPFLRLYVEE